LADSNHAHPWKDSADSLALGWSLADDRLTDPGEPGVAEPSKPSVSRSFSSGLDRVSRSRSVAASGIEFSLHLDRSSRPGLGSVLGRGPSGQSLSSSQGDEQPINFPSAGQLLAGFRIVSELGRGAFGRVYLATQEELADRPVALKVSKALGDEPRNLARLQHTHIVPIHSVHDDPETGLRLMCMPYVGGANLSQVLETAGARLASQATGRSLVDALDRVGGLAPDVGGASRLSSRSRARSRLASGRRSGASVSGPSRRLGRAATRGIGTPSVVRGIWGRYFARSPWRNELAGAELDPEEEAEPARRYLRSATYVQATVWIIARLAEALEHAHERGLLHRDLKPSNILIAADGTPMLLDFNLSAEIRASAADEGKAMLGGTLPYMAPEHLDAFNPDGTTPPEAVDERSDLYALGLILYEMLAGQHPFPDPPAGARMSEVLDQMTRDRLRGAGPIRDINPQVPWSLHSVLRLCLDPNPDRRYQTVGDLAEDLRLFLDDLPLKHAPELSLRERLGKWARRHPRICSITSVGALTVALAVGLGSAAMTLKNKYESSHALVQRQRFRSAFNECQLLLNTVSGPDQHLERGIREAGAAIDEYKVREAGNWTALPLVKKLPRREQEALREEMSELVQLRARALVHMARRTGSPAERRDSEARAVAWLNRAAQFDPHPTASLYEDRAEFESDLGDKAAASTDLARAAKTPLRGARDAYLRGTALLARGRLDAAEIDLTQATALDPQRFWAWFALGLCHDAQGRYAEAAGDFSACTALRPDFAWPHLNRGIALAHAGLLAEARASYDRALAANPDFIEALVNRGLVALESGDAAGAERDLGRAIKLGHRDPSIVAAEAEALSRLGRRDEAENRFAEALRGRPDDPALLVARGFSRLNHKPDAARVDFSKALEGDPKNAKAHLGLAYVLRAKDRRAALAEVERAIALSPGFLDAVQLRALLRAHLGDPAAESDADRLADVPTPHRLYNAACTLSILARESGQARYAIRALGLLRRALEAGFSQTEAANDPDLIPLHNLPEFQEMLARGR
jgi:serine/threonine protein kinase/Tfp pilus assembly protein PilF